ncbi:MAG: hypothetical protein H7Y19_00415 [Luteimonas sp.]|nr:hypothetical protein [Luteimonas sp.]
MNEARNGRWLMIAACLVVAATLAAAILVMGSPAVQREAKLDQRRIADLTRIARLADGYFERSGKLPPDLAILANQPGRRLSIADPVDGSPYAYEVTGNRTFRLCAVFATDTAKTFEAPERWTDEWSHGEGRQCFDRKANDDAKTN